MRCAGLLAKHACGQQDGARSRLQAPRVLFRATSMKPAPCCVHGRWCCREAQDARLAAWLWQWSAAAVGLQPAEDLPPAAS